jgi:hypothetical protein
MGILYKRDLREYHAQIEWVFKNEQYDLDISEHEVYLRHGIVVEIH